MTKRILIIGIDGATWTVLQPALAQGYMPFLSETINAGSSGVLQSTIPAITPAAWSSFQTGLNPGRTGIIDFSHWDKGKRERVIQSTRLFPKTIWEYAGEAGLRAGVLNLPMTFPPRPVDGFIVSGLLTPSLESDFTYPKSLKNELLANVPDYQIFHLDSVVEESRKENLDQFLKWVATIVSIRSRAARFLVGKYAPDIFMVHYQVNDIVQHLLWHYLDFDHERFDLNKWQAIMEGFYKVLDREIESVSRAFQAIQTGPAATLFVSDHGFQRHDRRFSLWNWMQKNGYLHLNLSRGDSADQQDHPPVNWDKTSAFPWGRSNEAFICVFDHPHRSIEETAGALVDELDQVTDPVSQSRVIKKVHYKKDIYHGERMEHLPDLIIEPCDNYSITGNYESDRQLFKTVVPGDDFHAGRHSPYGIIVASGDGIPSQRDIRANLIDMAPSILEYLGVPGMHEMDGQLSTALCPGATVGHGSESGRKEEQVEEESRDLDIDSYLEEVYSVEEKKIVEERLRNLGYL